MNQSRNISSQQRTLLLSLSIVGVLVLGAIVILSQDDSCAGILQQTAPRLEANLEIIENRGSVAVSQDQIQALSESSQRVGLHLETCCTVLDRGKLDSSQFQQCIDKASAYDQRIALIAKEATAIADAKESGATTSQEQIDSINQNFANATEDAESYVRHVRQVAVPVVADGSSSTVRHVTSNIPNVSVELVEFSRFENTLTLKVRFINAGEENAIGDPSYGSYLLDEATGKKYPYTTSAGHGITPAGGSVEYWVKYTMPEGERPKYLTAVLNGVLLEHLETSY